MYNKIRNQVIKSNIEDYLKQNALYIDKEVLYEIIKATQASSRKLKFSFPEETPISSALFSLISSIDTYFREGKSSEEIINLLSVPYY